MEFTTLKIRTKKAPTNENYTKILNTGFSKINENRITFSCFIGNCRFKSFAKNRFQLHLRKFHENDKEIQKQKCLICDKFESGKSLDDEFKHMIEHIEKPEQFETNFIEKENEAQEAEIATKTQPMRKAKMIENIKKEPESKDEKISNNSSKRKRRNTLKDFNFDPDSTTNDDEDEEEKIIPRKRRKIVTTNFIKKVKKQEELLSIKNLYPWIEDENIKKSIFKTKNGIETLCSELCQFSTYKCMNDNCCYFTTDFDDFKRHLIREHIDSYSHYCSFCLMSFKRPAELCSHIDLFHNLDRFQCSHCMYRASQKGYVFEHQKKFHFKETCTILKSPVQKLSKSYLNRVKNEMVKNRELFVAPYYCKTPQCKESFFCKISFIEHLEKERAEFGEIVQHQLSEISSSKTHGFTQCLYCKFGTDGDDILSHLAMDHQSKLAFICKRIKPTFICARQTLVTHTNIEFLGGHPAEMKSFEGDLSELTNDTELVLIEKHIETIVVDDN
ncbi:hypothetical protein PVAND_014940 [Polypedilum vanderplanki]|uniref:C2H2-type domain-containing protein n=1 Tax=Polypedilum vanderplanki TaxID=319348 RepID=A0A9J6BB76_POLVA|nr:hypothetical protein PVAND_014940 [Polypedilum vanderplanki]